jgi:glucose-6-phosphate isomerase
MLQIQTEHAGVETDDVVRQLEEYTTRLREVRSSGAYTEFESSLHLPGDEDLLARVQAVAVQKVTPQLKYHIVVGIGGSNLGTKAVYDALMGYRDLMSITESPRLLFAETSDPEGLSQLLQLLETISTPEEVLVSVISKSGGTTETLANFEIIMERLGKRFGDVTSRVVAITDTGSKLATAAADKGIATLEMPLPVGGRYSVFSAVGLFPLLSVGIDIVALRRGAVASLERCLAKDGDNIAAQSAAILALQQKNGHHINDNFFFHPELESVGKWYRQLMGESVGKEQSLLGEVVHAGITPTVSLGSTDLHSVGQLYLGGPKDKLTTFVSAKQSAAVQVPTERVFPDLVPMISGKSAADIMSAILAGVKIAYQKAELPFMEVVLDTVDEESIGAFLQFKMLEMMYLGQLLGVNSFDQPNVESYKIETKRLLEGA